MTSRSVPVKLDRPRHLKFSFNALADLQDADLMIFTKDVGSLPVIRRYLWAGLKHEDPTLTEERIGDILESWMEKGGDILELAAKVGEAAEGSVFSGRKGRKKEVATSVPQGKESRKNSEENGSGQ